MKRNSGATGPNVSSRATAIAGVTSGQHRRLEEAAAERDDAVPPTSTFAPFAIASAMWLSTFSTALSSMSGPCVAPGSEPGAGFSFAHRGGELVGERVVDRVLHQQPVRAHAGLPGVAVLRHDRAFHRRIQIRIVEDDERRVAAELERQLLDRGRALRHQDLADFGRSGERQLAHDRIGGQLAADLGRRIR